MIKSEVFVNLSHFFNLVDMQARMALKSEASKLYLSYIWWVLEPLLFVVVFYLVFEVFLSWGRENFLLFLICGKVPFLWFSKSVTSASNSIIQNAGLIGQLDISKSIFPYISIQESLYKQWVVFIVLFGVVISYGYFPEWNWLWLIPLMILQYGIIILCSLVGAFLVSFVSDFRLIINMVMMFLMFISGIFWDINTIGNPELRESIFFYNPVAFLIDGYRQVLIEQSVYDLKHLAFLSIFVLIGLLFCHQLMNKMSKIIASKVLGG